MTGYQREIDGRKITIGVSTMPNRKKLCLVVSNGYCITKYATFQNEEAAYEFMDIFARFLGAERIDWFGRDEVE